MSSGTSSPSLKRMGAATGSATSDAAAIPPGQSVDVDHRDGRGALEARRSTGTSASATAAASATGSAPATRVVFLRREGREPEVLGSLRPRARSAGSPPGARPRADLGLVVSFKASMSEVARRPRAPARTTIARPIANRLPGRWLRDPVADVGEEVADPSEHARTTLLRHRSRLSAAPLRGMLARPLTDRSVKTPHTEVSKPHGFRTHRRAARVQGPLPRVRDAT